MDSNTTSFASAATNHSSSPAKDSSAAFVDRDEFGYRRGSLIRLRIGCIGTGPSKSVPPIKCSTISRTLRWQAAQKCSCSQPTLRFLRDLPPRLRDNCEAFRFELIRHSSLAALQKCSTTFAGRLRFLSHCRPGCGIIVPPQ